MNALTSIQIEYIVIISIVTLLVIVIVIVIVILIVVSIVIIVVVKLQQILTKINTPNIEYQLTAIKKFGASIT